MNFSQQKHLFAPLAVICILLVSSCGENMPDVLKMKPKNKKAAFSAAAYLAKDTIGVFRGAEFGDEEGTIRQMENDTFLVFNSPNLLQYEYKLPSERRYKIDYNFKKNKLTSFNFDVFLTTEDEADRITTDLKKWFEKKFGDEVTEMGVFVWPIKTVNYKEAYLELKDESTEYGYGKVNISAYAIK